MTNGRPVRERLELDARKHPVVFGPVTGTIFGVVAYAFMGLLRGEWDVSSLISSLSVSHRLIPSQRLAPSLLRVPPHLLNVPRHRSVAPDRSVGERSSSSLPPAADLG